MIVSGPPGVGKTTLAKMISYKYLNEEWSFCAINSLEDGFAKIDDERPTIFFFDDFLGRIELDRQSLLQRDTALSTFVKRIRRSKNARFILTTRAHIFEEARRLSDHLDDRRLQLAKYLLDVGAYTRRIKAHILFNHLLVSGLSEDHFTSILKGDWLKRIVDHNNYNPRIIASVSSELFDSIAPEDYPKYIYSSLQDPNLVWSKPFKNLDMKCQNILITLFFGNQYGQKIDILRTNYLKLHREVCLFYSHPIKPSDFEEALRSLESGFISITGSTVTFINPSVRDFLKSYLIDKEFLTLLPKAAARSDWAEHLWKHIKNIFETHDEEIKLFSLSFKEFARTIELTPTYTSLNENGSLTYRRNDIPISERANLLLEWWESTCDVFFLEKMLNLIESSSLELISYRDGQLLPELYWSVNNLVEDENSLKLKILNAIKLKIVDILDGGVPPDDLVIVIERINDFVAYAEDDQIHEAIDNAAKYEFTQTHDAISELTTEDELNDHVDFLNSLARITGYNPDKAKDIVLERILELDEEEPTEKSTSFPQQSENLEEDFTENDLKSLFSNLLKS